MKRKGYRYRQQITYIRRFWWPSMRQFGFSPTDALLMALIAGLSSKKGFCFSGVERLAEQLNVSKPTIYASLRKLKDKGLVFDEWRPDYKAKCRAPTEKWQDFVKQVEIKRFEEEEFWNESEYEQR